MPHVYFTALVALAFLALVATFFLVALIHNARAQRRTLDLGIDNGEVPLGKLKFGGVPVIDDIAAWYQDAWFRLPGINRPTGGLLGMALSAAGGACYLYGAYPVFAPGALLGLLGMHYSAQACERSFAKESIPGAACHLLLILIGFAMMALNGYSLGTQLADFVATLQSL